MNERGAALLTVLWLVVILVTACATVLFGARLAHATSTNRIILRQAEWAQEACLETFKARYGRRVAPDSSGVLSSLDTLRLGRGIWCRAGVVPAGAKMNLNTLAPDLLRRVLRGDEQVDALLDWVDADTIARPGGAEHSWYGRQGRQPPRNAPVRDIGELALIRGFTTTDVRRLRELFVVDGDATIDPNVAPRELLHLLPGLDGPAVNALMARRSGGQPLTTMESLIEALPIASRETAAKEYLALAQHVELSGRKLRMDLEGGVKGWRPISHAALILQVTPGGIAVLQRKMQ